MKPIRNNKKPHYRSEPTIKIPKLPTEAEIRSRAHQLFLDRGESPGNELEDWLRAERELKHGSEPRNESRP